MKKESKNFCARICSLTEDKNAFLRLEIFDKKKKQRIYVEKIAFDITPKVKEFAATVDMCLLTRDKYCASGALKENKLHTSMWIDCKMTNLSTDEVIARQKIPCSFKELYLRFKGQIGTVWENEISELVYNLNP